MSDDTAAPAPQSFRDLAARDALPEIDTNIPHAARVYDYFLGGNVNFEADRAAGEDAAAVVGGMDNVRSEVRANRAFLGRSVQYAVDVGIRQFLDLGTGIPNEDQVHHVAQRRAPGSKIVYVDKDPVVLAHAHKLLRPTPRGTADYLWADVGQAGRIIAAAADILDFTEPVAVMLVGLLHHLTDEEDPWTLVRRYVDSVVPGSMLVVSHLASDIQPDEMVAAAEKLAEMNVPWIPRTHGEVARFFDGLDLVEPGVVQVDQWRADETPPTREGWENPLYVGVATKP